MTIHNCILFSPSVSCPPVVSACDAPFEVSAGCVCLLSNAAACHHAGSQPCGQNTCKFLFHFSFPFVDFIYFVLFFMFFCFICFICFIYTYLYKLPGFPQSSSHCLTAYTVPPDTSFPWRSSYTPFRILFQIPAHPAFPDAQTAPASLYLT